MSKKSSFAVIIASILSLGIFAGVVASSRNFKEEINNHVEAVDYANPDGYYNSISSTLEGTDLLNALNTLNNQKRKKTIGYKQLRYYYQYTERLPDTPSGKMYGFYDNTLVSSTWDNQATWNHEHVWPNSLGGGTVDADMHMARPASVKINSDRGNKCYAATGAYDPGQFVEEYRGVAARIIFYCAIANTNLKVLDGIGYSSGSNSMGKLSDLLRWNIEYAPTTDSNANPALRVEQVRNNAIYSRSDLQGNRNPFIDHPEYACRIWGNTNDTTKAICQGHGGGGDENEPSIRAVGTATKTVYEIGESFDPTGLTIIYNSGVEGEADIDVTSSVTFEPSVFTSSGTITVVAKYQDLVASCGQVTVKGEEIVSSPQVGVKYRLGFENTQVGTQRYINGDTSGSYACATIEDKDSAADVYLEQATGGYYIKVQKQGGSAAYLESYISGTYVNLRFSSTPVTVWSFNSEYKTFTTEITGSITGTYFIGTYNNYTDLIISAIEHISKSNNFPAHLYNIDQDLPSEKQLVISGTLYNDEYYVGDEFDPTGLYVNYIVDGVSSDVTGQVTWSLSTLKTAGEFELTASYDGLTAKYDGLVTVEHFEELQASGTLKKTTYYLNDWIETAGVTISYICDGQLTNVTSKVEWMPMQFTELGETYVVVYYCSAYGTDLYAGIGIVNVIEEGTSSEEMSSEEESSSEQSSEELSSEEAYSEDVSSEQSSEVLSSEQSSEEYSSEEVSQSEQQSSSEALSSEGTTSTQIESSEQSSEQTSVSESESKQESSSSGSEDLPEKGGCKASIGGSSSIVFIGGFVALFFAIRHLIKIKKEEK